MSETYYPRHGNSGFAPEVEPPDPAPEFDAGYAAFVEAMAPHCRCPNTVCGGVLAGGFCDTWVDSPVDDLELDDLPDDGDWDPDELDANGDMP